MITKFRLITPDGIHGIEFDKDYKSKADAWKAFNKWKKRFEHQGYYSSNEGRIPLDELKEHMTIIEI